MGPPRTAAAFNERLKALSQETQRERRAWVLSIAQVSAPVLACVVHQSPTPESLRMSSLAQTPRPMLTMSDQFQVLVV